MSADDSQSLNKTGKNPDKENKSSHKQEAERSVEESTQATEHPGQNFHNFLEEHEMSNTEPEIKTPQKTMPKQQKGPVITEETPVTNHVEYFSQTSQNKEVIKEPPPADIAPLSVANPIATVPTEDLSIPSDIQPSNIVNNQKASSQDLPPIPSAIQPNRGRKLSELMTMAYKQRKQINRADFQLLVKRRSQYYEKHVSIYDNATFQLLNKIKQTNEFIPSVIKYFTQLSEVYKNFWEGTRKMSAFRFLFEPQDNKKAPDPRLNWSPEINKSIKGILELKEETGNKMKTMEAQIAANIIPSMEKAVHDYNKRLEHLQKLSDKQKSKYLDCEQEVLKKVKRVQKLFGEEPTDTKDKKDLMACELDVFTEFSKAKKQLSDWGLALLNWWNEIITSEKQLVAHIKKNITSLLELYGALHGVTDKKRQCDEYWRQLDINLDVNRKLSIASVLPLTQYDFFKMGLVSMYDHTGPEYTLDDLAKFNTLEAEEKVIGDRKSLLNSLILKRFECDMLEDDKQKHRATVVSTVDEFLVFYDQNELVCYNRMQIKRLLNTRKSDYQVCVNEKIGGFIMDSWNREVLYFKSSDTAQQFMFYTQNSQEIKKDYVK